MSRLDEGLGKSQRDKKATDEALKKANEQIAELEEKLNQASKLKSKLELNIDQVNTHYAMYINKCLIRRTTVVRLLVYSYCTLCSWRTHLSTRRRDARIRRRCARSSSRT